MIEVTLYTTGGHEVTTVQVPPFALPPEGILWGERTFFRGPDGRYVEGLLWAAPEAFTVRPSAATLDRLTDE